MSNIVNSEWRILADAGVEKGIMPRPGEYPLQNGGFLAVLLARGGQNSVI